METGTKKVVGIIPARYKSSRLPGKPLVPLLGKPMIIWVAEICAKALGADNTYIATDDYRIEDVVQKYGFLSIMTSPDHFTGTDRLVEVAEKIDADIYINIQGDEPTLDIASIYKIRDAKLNNDEAVINGMAEMLDTEDPSNVNIPKVMCNEQNLLMYMSRLPVPGYKSSDNKPGIYYKQICIYAFNRAQLFSFGRYGKKGRAEQHEDIEILRFFELGIPVQMIEVEGNTFAVDVQEDIQVVERRLQEIHNL
ncbi:MAG TPA: 3-deoxy-manno-octulosonate cytidylyltransferase [Bacteroidales bacterium]|nr:3-deoxy-manno-octulosonate cytidylyltransferase [Bacteroidales bacterium]HRZ48692.1 3-deoxy-manno-octulosonate cytidylyltransferase [Bacteroidales bacterium]